MKLICQSPVEHDGKSYGVGQPLEIKDEAQGQALVDAGAAIEVVAEAKAKKAASSEGQE